MTHNIALNIMRKTDIDKNGFIEEVDVTKLSLDDPVSYTLLEDLYHHAADFMDKYRVVISGTKTASGPGAMSKVVGSQLRKSLNRDLENLQSQAQQRTVKQAQFREQPVPQNDSNMTRPIDTSTKQRIDRTSKSPGDKTEVIRGQFENSAPEALTVKRKAPKTKAERKGDCNSKYTAE